MVSRWGTDQIVEVYMLEESWEEVTVLREGIEQRGKLQE